MDTLAESIRNEPGRKRITRHMLYVTYVIFNALIHLLYYESDEEIANRTIFFVFSFSFVHLSKAFFRYKFKYIQLQYVFLANTSGKIIKYKTLKTLYDSPK